MDDTVMNDDFFSLILKNFGMEKKDNNEYSPLALAYLGDAIYDIVIRTVVVSRVRTNVNSYHKATSGVVKAQAQMDMYNAIMPLLTQEEISVFKKGRNANIHSKAKNAKITVYRKATGFEALMGFLYLTGQTDRMLMLIKEGMSIIESKQKQESV